MAGRGRTGAQRIHAGLTPHPRVPHLPTALVLAAGLSRRAAPHHKLLLPAPDGSGRSVIRATVEAMCGARAHLHELLVVTGHEHERIEGELAGLGVRTVFAADFARGMGHSLAAGVRAAAADTAGFLIAPGDLPHLSSALVIRVAAAAAAHGHACHVIPTADGGRGHPVFVAATLRAALAGLSGDAGARVLLASEAERARTVLVEVGDPAVLRDVDQAPDRP